MKLGDLMSYWVENYAREHCKKWRSFEREFELYCAPVAEMELESIRRADLVALQASLKREKGKSAANAAITLICMIYNKAIEWELYEGRNPASKLRKFRIPPRERFLQPEELPKFLDAVKQCRNPTTRDFFLALLYTGQRRRNVAEMKWSDIDFHRRVWNLDSEHQKNSKSHAVPLVDPLMLLLHRRRHAHPVWVFPRKDGKGPIWHRSTAWKFVLKRAGLSNLQIHDLRRTLASWQAITGASLPIIGRTLNHMDQKSTQIYAKLHLDPVRQSMTTAVDAMLRQ